METMNFKFDLNLDLNVNSNYKKFPENCPDITALRRIAKPPKIIHRIFRMGI